MMKPDNDLAAILFDVDGTLIDTYRLYLESYRQALAPLLGYGPTDQEIIDREPSAERRFLADWVGPQRVEACHAAMCRHYAALHATHNDGMYDGVREMLAGLRSAGIPLGIVTGKGRRAWEVTEAEIELGRFEIVVTEDDVAKPKPDPSGLLAAARAMGVDPANVIYIGDSAVDIEAGRRAGMRVGAALWPKNAPGERESFQARIARHEPDWELERPADVVKIFATWC